MSRTSSGSFMNQFALASRHIFARMCPYLLCGANRSPSTVLIVAAGASHGAFQVCTGSSSHRHNLEASVEKLGQNCLSRAWRGDVSHLRVRHPLKRHFGSFKTGFPEPDGPPWQITSGFASTSMPQTFRAQPHQYHASRSPHPAIALLRHYHCLAVIARRLQQCPVLQGSSSICRFVFVEPLYRTVAALSRGGVLNQQRKLGTPCSA